MEFETRQHLAVAQWNRDLAASLRRDSAQPLPSEWIVVIAFYAAVHYVNAYLWEELRVARSNHGERTLRVRTDRRLAACRAAYRRLLDAGYQARYTVRFQLTEQQARDLVMVDLTRVEGTVLVALGLPPTATT